MFTKEQLNQLKEVIRAETEPIKTNIQGVKQGQERLENRMDGLEQEMRAGFHEVNKKLDQSIEDNATFFNDAGAFFDTIKNDLVKRIQIIEEHLGLSEPTKN